MVTNDDRCTVCTYSVFHNMFQKRIILCKNLLRHTVVSILVGDLPRKNCSLADCDLHFFLAYEPLKILKGSKDAGKCMSCFLVQTLSVKIHCFHKGVGFV